MKKLLLILLVIPFISYSQINLDTINKKFSYSNVYEINKTKKQLHQNAMEWIAINFKDANEVVKLNTDDKIISKGYFDVSYLNSGYQLTNKVFFILEISFKENKYKLEIHTLKFNIDGIESPVDWHFYNFEYSFYLKTMQKLSDEANTKYLKKYYAKLLADQPKMIENFETQKALSLSFTNALSLELDDTANDLFNYIAKKSEDSW